MSWEQPTASFSELLRLRDSSQQLPTDIPGYALYQSQEFRWLVTAGDSIQSVMDRRDPSALVLANQRAMGEIAVQLAPAATHCLDLGTGGGAFLRFLTRRLPQATLCSVELNSALVTLVRRYFAIPEQQAIHVGDATDYLKANKTQFDLILVDLFVDDRMPESVQADGFFRLLSTALSDDGIVAMNTLPHSSQEMLDHLRAAMLVFPYLATLQFAELGNVLIFMSQAPLPSSDALAKLIQPQLAEAESASDLLASWKLL